MRLIVFLIICCLSFTHCTSSALEKPEELLSEKAMTSLITDLYLQQQMVNQMMLKNNHQEPIEMIAKNAIAILEAHEIRYDVFEANFKYYSSQPEVYKKILSDVNDRLYEQLSDAEKERMRNIEKNNP